MDAITDSLKQEIERRRLLLDADPFGEGLTGAFFGSGENYSDAPKQYRFERLGAGKNKFVLRIRSLPTRNVVAFVIKKCGERAQPLMDEWRGLFSTLADGPEKLAELTGFVPEFDYSEKPPAITTRAISNTARGCAGFGEANEIYAAEILRRRPPPARRPEQHFLEDASIMTAMIRHGVPVTFAIFNGSDTSPRLLKFGANGALRVFKPTKSDRTLLYRGFSSNNAYWMMTSFTSLCGRRMVETVGTRHLTLTLLDMARQGMKRAFLKDTLLKGGTWVVDLAGVDSEMRAATRLIETLGPDWYTLLGRLSQGEDGDVRRMLVQEFRSFDREHRFFCVDGRIVASTASDRNMTVFDKPPGNRKLDCRVAVLSDPADTAGAYDRGATTSVEDRALVAQMARLVRRMLAKIEEDDFIGRALLPKAFVVDVGSGPDGIGLIEINTFRNAGLYGVDYDRIAHAMKSADEWPDWIRLFQSNDSDGMTGDGKVLSQLGQVARWVMNTIPVTQNGHVAWSLLTDIQVTTPSADAEK